MPGESFRLLVRDTSLLRLDPGAFSDAPAPNRCNRDAVVLLLRTVLGPRPLSGTSSSCSQIGGDGAAAILLVIQVGRAVPSWPKLKVFQWSVRTCKVHGSGERSWLSSNCNTHSFTGWHVHVRRSAFKDALQTGRKLDIERYTEPLPSP